MPCCHVKEKAFDDRSKRTPAAWRGGGLEDAYVLPRAAHAPRLIAANPDRNSEQAELRDR